MCGSKIKLELFLLSLFLLLLAFDAHPADTLLFTRADCSRIDTAAHSNCKCKYNKYNDALLRCADDQLQITINNEDAEVQLHCLTPQLTTNLPPLLVANGSALPLLANMLNIRNCLPYGELLAQLHITPGAIVQQHGNATPTTLTSAHLGAFMQNVTQLTISGQPQQREQQQRQDVELPQWQLAADLFAHMPQLHRLELQLNVTSLPAEIFAPVSQLADLTLHGNLSALPRAAFRPLAALHILDLRQHQMQQLHDEDFRSTTALTALLLCANGIETLSAHVFAPLHALRRLSLLDNRLRALPSSLLAQQANLQFLELSQNQLETLPAQLFANTTSLLELRISANRLRYIDAASFVPLRKLQLLHLNDNQLTALSEYTFAQSENLQELQLQHNQLNFNVTKKCNAFLGLQQLRILDLSHNALTIFCTELGGFIATQLRVLNLHHNRLERLSNQHLRKWNTSVTLRQLTLAQNPWQCDCFAQSLVNFTRSNKGIVWDGRRMRCAEEAQKKALYELSYNDLCGSNACGRWEMQQLWPMTLALCFLVLYYTFACKLVV